MCELQEHFPIAPNLLSYHQSPPGERTQVTTERRGRWIDYSLAPDAMDRIRGALPGVDDMTMDVDTCRAGLRRWGGLAPPRAWLVLLPAQPTPLDWH